MKIKPLVRKLELSARDQTLCPAIKILLFSADGRQTHASKRGIGSHSFRYDADSKKWNHCLYHNFLDDRTVYVHANDISVHLYVHITAVLLEVSSDNRLELQKRLCK